MGKEIFFKKQANSTSETENRIIYEILPWSAPAPTDNPIHHHQSHDDPILM